MANVTIKDVAKEANVSIATVSRVINKNPKVAPEIAACVMSAIERIGYVPNQIARSLKSTSSKTIGVIIPDITNVYLVQTINAIGAYMQSRGYMLLLFSTLNNPDAEMNGIRLMTEKRVDGLIINTTGFCDDYIADLSRTIPTLLLHRRIDNTSFCGDWIDTDILDCARSLTRVLLEKGHRNIGCLNGPMYLSTAKMRFDGFCAAMNEAGIYLPENSPYLYEGDFSFQSGIDGAEYFMSLPTPPTAIVNMHGESTLGMLTYFRSHNIKVPRDVSIVSVSAIPNSDILYVQPYHYQMRPESIGIRAAQLMVERINADNQIGYRECCITMPIIDGNTISVLK